ncbi:methyltransferase domain-containing protein [Geotalea toluenoxydans]|uniref:methyltransferase domain-containing protein n=1 Tax=Geotalea toluenoxydans TaxID=421624 RepID=UPI001FB3F699|nr:methyltransferase domain-containing protein [Geotalea toluenoxydans]
MSALAAIRLKIAKIRRLHGLRSMRRRVAYRYLRGTGIEIGALHNPLKVPSSARVRYVDRMKVDDLRRHYPELRREKLVHVDIVDDGELLATVPDASQDFIIANHFIEHCENPLLALDSMLRVLRPLGILYLAVPDKRFTFDAERPATTIEHLLADFASGGEGSRKAHYEEWVRHVSKIEDEAACVKEVEKLMAMEYSIHFHSWTQREMLEMLLMVQQRHPFDIETFVFNIEENIFIIRKSDGDGQGGR